VIGGSVAGRYLGRSRGQWSVGAGSECAQ
jgi:hypothetical protein